MYCSSLSCGGRLELLGCGSKRWQHFISADLCMCFYESSTVVVGSRSACKRWDYLLQLLQLHASSAANTLTPAAPSSMNNIQAPYLPAGKPSQPTPTLFPMPARCMALCLHPRAHATHDITADTPWHYAAPCWFASCRQPRPPCVVVVGELHAAATHERQGVNGQQRQAGPNGEWRL